MRQYVLTALIAFAVGGLFTGAAALITHNQPAPAAISSGKGGEVWGANYFPNIPLVTHDGQRVRFFDDLIKDKVVAINFIYTSCPDSCPMETARLLEVSRILGDRMGKDVFFYSITIDPEYDTQPVLEAFAANWDIGPGWKFLTGDEDDIILLRKKLGLYIEEIQSEDSQDHNLNLVIGNQSTGRWMRRSPFENSYVLANQMGSWLHNWKIPSEKKWDYADAPELRTITSGENLFRTRCASCHTIGQGDVIELAERRIGPDLYNVTQQRDPEWLLRWMAEPDKMLEEKDPLAMALLAQYKNVPMPNLRLNDRHIEQLLDYIAQESRRIHQLEAGNAAPRGPGDHSNHGDHSDHAAHNGDPGQQGEHAQHSVHTGEL